MERTNIYLTDRQQVVLSRLAKRLGISKAELIRRIIDGYLQKKGVKS